MANKKINELSTRTPSLTDLILVGDPSSGYSYKATVTALADIIETDIGDAFVTLSTTQTISGAKTFSNNLTLTSVSNANTDTDKFIVLNASNVVNFRTGSEVLSDIGAQGTLTLTTSGSSGAATLVSNTLNIPNYTLSGLGGVPTTRTITINGTAQDLSVDRTWSVGTVTSVAASAGTGISISGSPITSSGTITITNTAPDQTVVLTAGTGISTLGTYPNFTITNSAPDQTVALTAGTGISISGTYPNFTITNSSPSLGGTVTSVAMSVPTGFAISGSPITSSGTLGLTFASGYSLPTTASQTNWDSAYNNMIVSAAVTGTTTKTLTLTQQDAGTITATWTDDNTDAVTSVFGRTGAVVATEGDYSLTQLSDVTITSPTTGQVLKYNGTTWVNDTDANTGTVTSVALSAPTGFSVSGSPVTSSGTLTLSFASGYSLPTTASQTNWDTAYTNRITSLTTTGSSGSATLISNTLNIPTYTLAGLGGISLTSLSASAPLSYNNTTGAFSISQATTSTNGYLSSTDWNTFNNKQSTITLTTTGSSGSATFVSNTLNIPTYTLSGLGGEPAITAGTTSQYFRGDKTFQTLNTAAVTESANLYYTDARARASISLTTTGTSGAATYDNSTGVLNIPQYSGGSGTVSGTTNYLAKFTSSTAVGNSSLFDDGTNVGIGTATAGSKAQINGNLAVGYSTSTAAPTNGLQVAGQVIISNELLINGGSLGSANGLHQWYNTSTNQAWIQAFQSGVDWRPLNINAQIQNLQINDVTVLQLNNSRNVGISTTTIGSKLQVNGNAAIGYSASTAAPTNGLAVSGRTLINTTTDSYSIPLQVNGQISTQLPNSLNKDGLRIYATSTSGNGSQPGLGYYNPSSSRRYVAYVDVGAGDSYNIAGASIDPIFSLNQNGQVTLSTGSNVSAIAQTGYSLTGSNASSLIDLAGTWNTTGNPTAIKLNITNTASGATSRLMDLQIGGVSQFTVTKGGAIQTSAPSGGTAKPWKLGEAGVTLGGSNTSGVRVEIDGTVYYLVTGYLP